MNPASTDTGKGKGPLQLAGAVAHMFIQSKLTPLIIITALIVGAFSIWQTPREEEPQIVVPMLDVFVQMPGASASEVEQRVSIPMEKLLREVPGVEYIYSISHPGMSMIVVRFYVGTKEEDAIVKTYNKLYSNFDRIPPGVSQPIIKARSIDDVPILALTLWGNGYDAYRLRQVAGELEHQLKQLNNVSETKIIGGQPRQVRVVLDTTRLAAYGLTPAAVVHRLEGANARQIAGSFANDNREFQVEAGRFLSRPEELNQIVVGVYQGRPVYLRDVAEKLDDGPAEPDNYVMFANARGSGAPSGEFPAVTITFAKRKGTNASVLAEEVTGESRFTPWISDSERPEHYGHPKLRGDGEGEIRRTAEASVVGDLVRNVADSPGAGVARVGSCSSRDSCHAGAHTRYLLFLWIHTESRHLVRIDLLYRHSR